MNEEDVYKRQRLHMRVYVVFMCLRESGSTRGMSMHLLIYRNSYLSPLSHIFMNVTHDYLGNNKFNTSCWVVYFLFYIALTFCLLLIIPILENRDVSLGLWGEADEREINKTAVIRKLVCRVEKACSRVVNCGYNIDQVILVSVIAFQTLCTEDSLSLIHI